ncbi:MAG: hypothetical protein LBG72_05475 [Spirochaetaceae bacterium]|jgi:hypothetical protein|nr:hypothetical protein [Spirochaetaceae bacterium]
MACGILMAGTENLLLTALARRLAQGAVPYALALASDEGMPPAAKRRETRAEERHILDWLPQSPLSARALVIAAENRLGIFDAALLVCAAPSRIFPADPDCGEISAAIDRYVKSYLFLARELRAYFRKHGGTLAFVCAEGGAFGGPLSSLITQAFYSFAGEVLLKAQDEKCIGFLGARSLEGAVEADDFAAFILKTMENQKQTDTRKWQKFGGSSPLAKLKNLF